MRAQAFIDHYLPFSHFLLRRESICVLFDQCSKRAVTLPLHSAIVRMQSVGSSAIFWHMLQFQTECPSTVRLLAPYAIIVAGLAATSVACRMHPFSRCPVLGITSFSSTR